MFTTAVLPMESAPADISFPDDPPPPTFFATKTVEGVYAVTDRGRRVPLMRYEAVSIMPAGQSLALKTADDHARFLGRLEQKFLENTKQDPQSVYKLVEPFPASNCHGWIMTGGKYGVCDTLLLSVLEDNGYVASQYVEDGDLVVFTHTGQVKHSGIVRIDASGSLFVESKWGPFGVYLHGIETHPFAKTISFFRSQRKGHLLTIMEETAAPES